MRLVPQGHGLRSSPICGSLGVRLQNVRKRALVSFHRMFLKCSGKPNLCGLHSVLGRCFTVACSQALEAKDPLHSFPLFSAPFLAISSASSFPGISEWDGV
jgi:hypothetical protein